MLRFNKEKNSNNRKVGSTAEVENYLNDAVILIILM